MPSTSTLPAVGSSRKLMHLRSVLFPDPERPKTTTTSPSAMSRSMPFKTSFSPNTLRRPRRLTMEGASVPMRAAAFPHVALGQSPLQASLEVGEDAGEYPVDDRRHHQHLQVLEVLAADLQSPEEQLLSADEADQGGVFHHGDDFVGSRGDDPPHGLREHYTAHGLRPRHAQRLRRLDLPVTDRLYAGTEDLRHVRPVVDP